jgi:hypothetical protein
VPARGCRSLKASVSVKLGSISPDGFVRQSAGEPSGLRSPGRTRLTADGWPGPDTVAKIYSDLAAKK